MRQLKREYADGTTAIIIWKQGKGESLKYIINYSQNGGCEAFLKIQSTRDSEIIGAFYGVNEKGTKAVSNLLSDNMLQGKLKVITSSELENILCED